MKLTRLFLALCSVALMVSCTEDEAVLPKGSYEKGVFVLSEGTDKGSVSFLNSDLTNFTQNVYDTENPSDKDFGFYVQSIFFNGDNAYIISGGTNKITVVNRYTFKLITKIETGLVNPRYGVVKGNKAYVTNANTYSYISGPIGNTDDYVAVINLDSNTYESKINLNATGNRILLYNDKLYITEPYDSSNLLVVNTLNNALEAPVAIGSNANVMEIESGVLYTLRSPYGDRSEVVKVKLSDNSVSKISFATALDGASFMDIYKNKIYYTVDNAVYAIDLSATTASTTPLFSYTKTDAKSQTYGFAVENDRVHFAEVVDYKTNGKAFIFNLTGTLLKEATVGIGPNGFYFNN